MASKKISFRVTSMEGDTEYSLLPKQAVTKIKSLAREENKWVYIGGEIQNTELLSESDLLGAYEDESEIVLMNAIAGGDCCGTPEKPIEVNLSIEKDVEMPICIDIEDSDYVKAITITIAKDAIYDVLHDRNLIVSALERKLNEFAEREVDGMKTALNVD